MDRAEINKLIKTNATGIFVYGKTSGVQAQITKQEALKVVRSMDIVDHWGNDQVRRNMNQHLIIEI